MQPNFKEYIGAATGIDYFVGDADRVLNMENTRAMPPFSDKAVDFFNDLSKLLLKKGRAFSDVATFAFWCRKASLEAYKKSTTIFTLDSGAELFFTARRPTSP